MADTYRQMPAADLAPGHVLVTPAGEARVTAVGRLTAADLTVRLGDAPAVRFAADVVSVSFELADGRPGSLSFAATQLVTTR